MLTLTIYAAAFSVDFTFFHIFKAFLPRRLGGGGAVYKLYQYVRPQGVGFLSRFGLKRVEILTIWL